MIAVFDRYTNGTGELLAAIRRLDPAMKTAVLGDDSFSSYDGLSLYDYYLYGKGKEIPEEKSLHYNFIEVPPYWEIRSAGWRGAIYDMGCKKADVYFSQDSNNAQRVEWSTESGWIYKVDYYNKYALKYASEFRDKDGNVESKAFYSRENREVLIEQPQNDVVYLLENGGVKRYFTSYSEFIEYFFQETGLKGERVFFVQDKEGLRLAALRSDGESIWRTVLFQRADLLNQYVAMGGTNGRYFYAVPEEYPDNGASGEALILTRSDQLEGIEQLIQELPEVHFHIAANTQVSDKLHRLGERQNVRVYPQISQRDLEMLWNRCDFYFDINHYLEYVNAIDTAHRENLLIMGFENTLHRRELVNPECIYAPSEIQRFADEVRELIGHPEWVEERLRGQQARKREAMEEVLRELERRQDT